MPRKHKKSIHLEIREWNKALDCCWTRLPRGEPRASELKDRGLKFDCDLGESEEALCWIVCRVRGVAKSIILEMMVVVVLLTMGSFSIY
jgi:hypothetical protein